MTTEFSMQAMILTESPQLLRMAMLMLNTRYKICAQVMAARRSAGIVYRAHVHGDAVDLFELSIFFKMS